MLNKIFWAAVSFMNIAYISAATYNAARHEHLAGFVVSGVLGILLVLAVGTVAYKEGQRNVNAITYSLGSADDIGFLNCKFIRPQQVATHKGEVRQEN